MNKVVLVRYGEIFLKGKNRKFFEDCLKNNIQNAINFSLTYTKQRRKPKQNDKAYFIIYNPQSCSIDNGPGVHQFSGHTI